jgi:hypothetical protein
MARPQGGAHDAQNWRIWPFALASREHAKDEPGATDFYYGETEMRRHARGQADSSEGEARGRVDRGGLAAYWLVSGYGLRAWRALAWLAGMTVAFAFAFHVVGFIVPPQPATFWTSLLIHSAPPFPSPTAR